MSIARVMASARTFAKQFAIRPAAINVFNAFPDKLGSPSPTICNIIGGGADGRFCPRNGGPFALHEAFW